LIDVVPFAAPAPTSKVAVPPAMLKNERLFEPVSFVMAIAIGVPDVYVVEPAKTFATFVITTS
jgi:hypothetical protein